MFLRSADRADAPDARTVAFIPGDDPPELKPALTDHTANLLAGGGTLELGATWSGYDWMRFCARWLAVGTVLAAVVLGAVEVIRPWDAQAGTALPP